LLQCIAVHRARYVYDVTIITPLQRFEMLCLAFSKFDFGDVNWQQKYASCRGCWGERSCLRGSATAIPSVAVDRTPNLFTEKRTLSLDFYFIC